MADDDTKIPMAPNVEPPGYTPPMSAKELLERYAICGTCVSAPAFRGAEWK